jgi:hypothetical protein
LTGGGGSGVVGRGSGAGGPGGRPCVELGITGAEGADCGPSPAALLALTVKVYCVPFTSP